MSIMLSQLMPQKPCGYYSERPRKHLDVLVDIYVAEDVL